MAEVPSVAYWIPTYARMGIDGVSIGSNDLTQLMLGVDRDSEVCAELFDEADPAVLDAIARIVHACQRGRHHVLAVRAGAVEPSGVRRVPRAARGSPRCRSTRTPSKPCATSIAAAERRLLLEAIAPERHAGTDLKPRHLSAIS